MPVLYLPAQNKKISVPAGTKLFDALKAAGIYPDAPCGGNGTCGKCTVIADGASVLACQFTVSGDVTVQIPFKPEPYILQTGPTTEGPADLSGQGAALAIDIGTTSVVCFLLDRKTGAELAKSSMLNPQTAFGADVVCRIQSALRGEFPQLTALIRQGTQDLIQAVCSQASISPNEISVISVVGNPAMQQLFFGISPDNLASPPFAPALTAAKTIPCKDMLPLCPNARLLIVPDISGYIGADTLGCILSTALYQTAEITLLVDIGTNGEMVLGNQNRMIACSTAAGPALEGANILFGMRAADGAIDHVWLENGEIKHSVIGGGKAVGICGSGLVDAVAVMQALHLLNGRGRIQNPDRRFYLTDTVYLTQDDIRQVQLAKGAICAGICLMAKHLGIELSAIQQVLLAGAFGSFLNPESACRIGLLPDQLQDRIVAVGNAAGSGAKMLACDPNMLALTQELINKTEFLELASLPDFPKTFAKAMHFREEAP